MTNHLVDILRRKGGLMAKFHTAFGLIGSAGAGKTTFANYLVNQTRNYTDLVRCEIFDSSKYLAEQLETRGIAVTREAKQLLAEKLFGDNPITINEVLYQQMIDCPRTSITPIIDSIRSEQQADRWKILIPNIQFVYFDITDDLRFKLYNKREIKQGRKALTSDGFNAIHHSFVDKNLERLKTYAKPENVIVNNGDMVNFQDQVWKIFLGSGA